MIAGTSVMGFEEGSNRVAENLGDRYTMLVLAQFAGWVATACLLVFSVGFYRLLQSRVPAASMIGMVAGAALLASVAANIAGYGSLASIADSLPGDRFYFVSDDDANDPVEEQRFPAELKATLYWDASNAICYAWIGVCAAAGATALAVFRYGAFAKWTGYFSAFIAGIMTLFVFVGLPFGAVFWGPLWLLVMGVALGLKAPAWSRAPLPAGA